MRMKTMETAKKPSSFSDFEKTNPGLPKDEALTLYRQDIDDFQASIAAQLGIDTEELHELGPIVAGEMLGEVELARPEPS